jgi:glutaminase
MDLQSLLDEIALQAPSFAVQGRVADYIPVLARVDASRFGIALATVDGQHFGAGDYEVPFSVQSVSKAFGVEALDGFTTRTGWSVF